MEFIDLQAQLRRIEKDIRAGIDTVLSHGHFINGPEVEQLEKALAAKVKAKFCICCASGTDALLMPLMAWGIGPGDAVFVPSFTFFASAEVVSLLGAVPVFVDVDPETFTMSPDGFDRAVQAILKRNADMHPLPAEALSKQLHPKAVMPVDMFGLSADYTAITPIARKYGLKVIEDGAQSFGGERFGRFNCGQDADCAATSFFPAKPLGCYGDGGAVFTNDADLAAQVASIRAHGKGNHKYENVRIGINGRLDTLQAAILLPKLAILDDEIRLRGQVAKRYAERLGTVEGVLPPTLPVGSVSAWAQYTVRVAPGIRDILAANLKSRGVPTAIYYPKPLHMQSAFASSQYTEDSIPLSSRICSEVLSLPFHPYLKLEDQEQVCASITDILREVQ